MTLRLGLITCDTIWEPLRTRHGDYADMITHWLATAGASFELRLWAAHEGHLPDSVDACDAWIVSGSRAGVYEDLTWIAPLMAWVRAVHAAGRPQLGICFGHQLLAEALGGRTTRAPDGWGVGNFTQQIQARVPGAPTQDTLALFMAHQDQVVALPRGAVWLAATRHCRHAMFVFDNRVLGMQAHPEFTAAFMRDMTRDDTIPLSPVQRATALASYDDPVDAVVVGRWVADFLANRWI